MESGQLNEWPKFESKNLDPEFFCKKCKNVMFYPHQADDCGCRYCLKCLEEILKDPSFKCISCGISFASDTAIPDKFLQKKIQNLEVKCIETDCDFKGKLIQYKDHYQKEHMNNAKNTCQHCSRQFSAKEQLAEHLDFAKGDCPKQLFVCPYEKIGCDLLKVNSEGSRAKRAKKNESGEKMDVPEDGKRSREDIYRHLDECVSEHLDLLHASSDKNFDALRKAMSANQAEIEKLKAGGVPFNYSESTAQSEASGFTRYKPAEDVEMDASTTPKGFEYKPQHLDDLKIQLSLVETAQNAITSDMPKLVKNDHMLKSSKEKLKETMNDYKTQCQDLQKTLLLTQVSMLALEERLINQEKVSYNGTLMWKITNVNERIQEAKQGRQTSFYSPPFYTSRNGFKMCARIHLNGEGNGRNTHLSLFFVLLRGENDSLLKWPFRQKVSFTLIDQSLSESREHIIDAFPPDPNSSSFRRPISEMNIASGLPLFCPLAKLMSNDHEYIKDNTMFIKIIVDVKDLKEI